MYYESLLNVNMSNEREAVKDSLGKGGLKVVQIEEFKETKKWDVDSTKENEVWKVTRDVYVTWICPAQAQCFFLFSSVFLSLQCRVEMTC